MMFSPEQHAAMSLRAHHDFYHFTRWMFLRRRNYKWSRAPHHKQIADALMRVYRGECKRLLINIPPRYSKTEIAVINFVAWTMGRHPDSEYIHASYSAMLAGNNSSQIRTLVQHEDYRAIFPGVELATEAAHHWKTTAGGVMYATGTGGTITGFGAGKHREGWGGCFPAGTRVWTESGLIPIDDIVNKRLSIRVWSYDYNGEMILRDVTEWHKNPPNEIIRVAFNDGNSIECTPDHKLWVEGRGWVRADSVCIDDRIISISGTVERLDNISINTKHGGGWLNSPAILDASSVLSVVNGYVGLFFGKLRSKVSSYASFVCNIISSGYGSPCVPSPNLIDDRNTYSMPLRYFFGWLSNSIVYLNGRFIIKRSAWVNLCFTKSTMPLAVLDVIDSSSISKIIKRVVLWVSVKMTNIHSQWPLSRKSNHHKDVNKRARYFRVFGKIYSKMSAVGVRWIEKLSGLKIRPARPIICDAPVFASNPPFIANRIKPFVSGYRLPVLVEHVRHDDITYCIGVDEYHNFTIESGVVVKNCIVIDDAHKADEARSEVMRQNVIDWFQNTLESRKNSRETPIIVIMQRLHENDLSGWLLNGGNGEEWEHLCLPAIQPDGTALWPEKHSLAELRVMEQASPYVFAGQYMQRPAPLDGGIFKPGQIQIIDALPAERITWVRGWDFAATLDGDYTAGGLLGRLPDGRFVIADMVRLKALADERDSALVNTSAMDGKSVKVSIPQDPGQAGKTQILYLTRKLAGYRIHTSPETGDKITRAEPFAAQVNVGNVLMLRGGWNSALIDEMRMFPNGSNDDQVDALSRAFSELITPIRLSVSQAAINKAAAR